MPGFLLQIDDPTCRMAGIACPTSPCRTTELRGDAGRRVEPCIARHPARKKVRLHVCWGSFHGPHHDDIPLSDIIDLIFRVNAGSYSIEASNPCHEHEWRVFEEVKLPEGATLVPGVVGHCSDFIEHPDLVAERLVRYARLVGAKMSWPAPIAGSARGSDTRRSASGPNSPRLAEGARRATKILWGRA